MGVRKESTLNIEKTIRNDHQAELVVEVEAERWESARRRAARKLAERGHIPGFRPGKAPYDVVRRYYGDQAIFEQAIDLLMEEIYLEALRQADIEPVAPASLEKIESLDPPKFVFLVPLAPVVELGDYLSVRVPYEWTPPDETHVNRALEKMRYEYGTTEKVDRPAQEGDYVLVSIRARKEGDPEGTLFEALSYENLSYLIASEEKEEDEEWPFPGFSRHLIGVRAGETITFSHSYPEDAKSESLRGVTVTFEVTVQDVRALTLPELNDDFARMVADGIENLEDLKAALRDSLSSHSQEQYDSEYSWKVIDKICEGATIKYPPQMLEEEMKYTLHALKNVVADQGLDWKAYLRLQNMTEEQLIEATVRPLAIQRLKHRLVIEEIIRHHNLTPDTASMERAWYQTLNQALASGLIDSKTMVLNKRVSREIANFMAHEAFHRAEMHRAYEMIKAIGSGKWKPDDEAAASTSAGSPDDSPAQENEGATLSASVESATGETQPGDVESPAGVESEPLKETFETPPPPVASAETPGAEASSPSSPESTQS